MTLGSTSQRVEPAQPAPERVGTLLSVNVGCRRTCRGRAGRSSPASSRTRSPVRGACAGSTSTATARAIWPATAASSAPCSSTRSTRTGTGSASWAETTSASASSARTSPSTGSRDDEVCIGDRYRIGSAVFEVTQPRVTCYRVGLRMDDPRIPALLVSHRRPGFYFRVLEEGDVQAGDEIVKLASGPEQMTVAEVDGAALPARAPAPGAAPRAADPGAQPRLAGVVPSAARQEPGRQRRSRRDEPAAGVARFPAADRRGDRAESDAVFSVRLEDPGRRAARRARPGQYLTLRVRPDPGSGRCCATTRSRARPAPAPTGSASSASPEGAASGYLHTASRRRRPSSTSPPPVARSSSTGRTRPSC